MGLVICLAADAYMNLADYWLLYIVVTHDQRSATKNRLPKGHSPALMAVKHGVQSILRRSRWHPIPYQCFPCS